MKKEDAEREVINLWRSWLPDNTKVGEEPTLHTEGQKFYHEFLMPNHYHLLDFKTANPDKWQVVASWLKKHLQSD